MKNASSPPRRQSLQYTVAHFSIDTCQLLALVERGLVTPTQGPDGKFLYDLDEVEVALTKVAMGDVGD